MYKLKNISQLGNVTEYSIDYTTFYGTYDITIYNDESFNTWDGTLYDGNSYRDIESDMAVLIVNDIMLQQYEGMI